MLSEKKYLELQRLFYKRFRTIPGSGRYIPYEDHAIPSDMGQGTEWWIFHTMAEEFNQELKNEINGFLTNIRKLEAWSQIETESEFDLDLKYDFCVEIFDPVASAVLNTPYIVSQRFIYCSTMLLHQTRMIVDPDWKDGELDEGKIIEDTLEMFRKFFENRDDKIKPVFRKVRKNVHNIHQFSSSTGNYRNLYHHRIRRRVGIGITSMIGRMRNDDGAISYGFGGLQPIEISEILPEIYKQHGICVRTFDAYWDLVTELLKIWEREQPCAKVV